MTDQLEHLEALAVLLRDRRRDLRKAAHHASAAAVAAGVAEDEVRRVLLDARAGRDLGPDATEYGRTWWEHVLTETRHVRRLLEAHRDALGPIERRFAALEDWTMSVDRSRLPASAELHEPGLDGGVSSGSSGDASSGLGSLASPPASSPSGIQGATARPGPGSPPGGRRPALPPPGPRGAGREEARRG